MASKKAVISFVLLLVLRMDDTAGRKMMASAHPTSAIRTIPAQAMRL